MPRARLHSPFAIRHSPLLPLFPHFSPPPLSTEPSARSPAPSSRLAPQKTSSEPPWPSSERPATATSAHALALSWLLRVPPHDPAPRPPRSLLPLVSSWMCLLNATSHPRRQSPTPLPCPSLFAMTLLIQRPSLHIAVMTGPLPKHFTARASFAMTTSLPAPAQPPPQQPSRAPSSLAASSPSPAARSASPRPNTTAPSVPPMSPATSLLSPPFDPPPTPAVLRRPIGPCCRLATDGRVFYNEPSSSIARSGPSKFQSTSFSRPRNCRDLTAKR